MRQAAAQLCWPCCASLGGAAFTCDPNELTYNLHAINTCHFLIGTISIQPIKQNHATGMLLRSGRRFRQQAVAPAAAPLPPPAAPPPAAEASILLPPPQAHQQQHGQQEDAGLLHLPHHLLCELYKLLPADGASRRAFAHSCRDVHDAVGGVEWSGVGRWWCCGGLCCVQALPWSGEGWVRDWASMGAWWHAVHTRTCTPHAWMHECMAHQPMLFAGLRKATHALVLAPAHACMHAPPTRACMRPCLRAYPFHHELE